MKSIRHSISLTNDGLTYLVMNEAQRFANLVCELRTLLDNYFKVTEYMKSDPFTMPYLIVLSIQVIDQYRYIIL